MKVELSRDSYAEENRCRRANAKYKPLEHYQIEVEPEEFALKYATALCENPSLEKDDYGQYTGDEAVFAVIFGQDPERFRVRKDPDEVISHEPRCVNMGVICDGKLVQVTIGPNDNTEHFFFRITEEGLRWLPYGKNCWISSSALQEAARAPGFTAKKGTPAWPWIALYPEKFAALIEFAEILNPSDENPLTGLLGIKDTPSRTLARQIVSRLEIARDNWIRDIVDSL